MKYRTRAFALFVLGIVCAVVADVACALRSDDESRVTVNTVSGSGGALATSVDTSHMSFAGQLCFFGTDGVVYPTNALAARSATVACVYGGTPNEVLLPGQLVQVEFTADGGKPQIGATMWVASSTDDSDTGLGKATATQPLNGVLGYENFNYMPASAVRIGTVAGIADGGTAALVMFLPEPQAPKPLMDVVYFADELGGFTSNDYLSTTGNSGTAYATWADGETKDIIFTVEANEPSPYGGVLWANTNSSTANGWMMYETTSGFYVEVENGTTYPSLHFTKQGPDHNSVHLAHGIHRLVASIDNGIMYGCLDGNEYASTSMTVSAPAGSGMIHSLGYSQYYGVAWPGKVLGAAHETKAVAKDKICERASSVAPAYIDPTNPPNRFQLDADTIREISTAGGWVWHDVAAFSTDQVDFYSNVPFTQSFTWTQNGSVTRSSREEQLYLNIAQYWQDTEPVVVDSSNVPRTTLAARIHVSAPASMQEMGFGVWGEDADNQDQDAYGSLFRDGWGTSNYVNRFPLLGPKAETRIRWFWQNVDNAQGTNGAPTSHTFDIVQGQPGNNIPWYNVLGHRGDYIVAFAGAPNHDFYNTGITFGSKAVDRRLVVIGEAQAIGHNVCDSMGPAYPQRDGLVTLLRADYPSPPPDGGTLVGGVTGECSFQRATPDMLIGGTYDQFLDTEVIPEALEGNPSSIDILIALGFIDYYYGSTSPSDYATNLGNLVDGINTRLAGKTHTVWLSNVVQNNKYAGGTWDSTTSPVGGMYNLAAYNTASAAVCGMTHTCTYLDARTPNSVTLCAGNAGSDITKTGQVAWHDNIKYHMGY